MDPAETLADDTADEGESPVITLHDTGGLAAECVVAETRWLEVFDEPFQRRAAAAVRACLSSGGATAPGGGAGFTVKLVGDEEMSALNGAHRGKPAPTNVLSFPADSTAGPEGPYLGDIAMAWGVTEREAGELGISIGDHTLHLLVHGVLHLLGHDHGTDREAARMEDAETSILAGFGVADPHSAEGGAER